MITGSAKYYSDITRLPLARFIDCAVDGDPQSLVISGEPSEAELLAAWYNISSDYNDAMAADTLVTIRINAAQKNIVNLEAKIAAAERFVDLLKSVYVRKFVEELNRLTQAKIELDVTNPDEYDRSLIRYTQRLKGLKLHCNLEKARLSRLLEEIPKGGQKPTREYFHKLLINLCDSAGYDLNPETLSTFSFCERVRRYVKTLENKKINTPKKLQNGRRIN
ncbi:MAG: hypothetical protein HZA79_05050 [Sphingobacteriales bacterium]|nr:hypothetical protein [Sphingobacteriales bacterium]